MTDAAWTMVGGPPDLPTGPDGVRALFATFGEITQTWQIEDVVAEGDKVVVRATNRCVQDSFFGVPAAGVSVFTRCSSSSSPTGWPFGPGATRRTCSGCCSWARGSSRLRRPLPGLSSLGTHSRRDTVSVGTAAVR